jgi:hypothetical protein
MAMEAPPGRYRIVERDRTLVTIDTLTGEAVGQHAGPVAEAATPDRGTPEPPLILKAPEAERRSALTPPPRMQVPGIARDRQGRIVALVAGAIALVAFLMFSGLWIFAAIPFLVPQTRSAIVKFAKEAIPRFIDGG